MLGPHDYSEEAIHDPRTRQIMSTIAFEHGGAEYDRRYPDGIPTSLVIGLKGGASHDSGLVMYPAGHARNTTADLRGILDAKFRLLGKIAVRKPSRLVDRLAEVGEASAKELRRLLDVDIIDRGRFE